MGHTIRFIDKKNVNKSLRYNRFVSGILIVITELLLLGGYFIGQMANDAWAKIFPFSIVFIFIGVFIFMYGISLIISDPPYKEVALKLKKVKDEELVDLKQFDDRTFKIAFFLFIIQVLLVYFKR